MRRSGKTRIVVTRRVAGSLDTGAWTDLVTNQRSRAFPYVRAGVGAGRRRAAIMNIEPSPSTEVARHHPSHPT
jgi:hypothetical protein